MALVAAFSLVGCGESDTATVTTSQIRSSSVTPAKGAPVVVDLGTLGGVASWALALNDRGQVVGWAETGEQGADGTVAHGFLWQDGTMRDLGTLPGDESSSATAINERGLIIGYGSSPDADHGYLWQNGAPRDLGSLGWCCTEPRDVNEHGDIVGLSERPRGSERAFLWQRGKMFDLGTHAARWSEAWDVNDRGEAVGGQRGMLVGESGNALLWEAGRTHDLGTLAGDDFSVACAINELGQVVVNSWREDPRPGEADTVRAFAWWRGQTTALGALGGIESEALAVNDRGQVVGRSETSSGAWHGFVWQQGTMIDLGTLGGAESEAVAVNERGQVAGRSQTRSGSWHGFVWENGRMVDLGTAQEATECDVSDLNERGQIVSSCGRHAVVWTLAAGG
jgi:probable HAF family extracellular repeat protein